MNGKPYDVNPPRDGSPYDTSPTLQAVARPRLGDERNEIVRAYIRKMVASQFGGSVRAAARAMSVQGSTLNEFLRGDSGAGMKLLDGLSKVAGRSLDEILAPQQDTSSPQGAAPTPRSSVTAVSFGQLPNWPELQAFAASMRPQIPQWAWDALAESQVWLTVPITGQLVIDLGEFLARHMPPPPPSGV